MEVFLILAIVLLLRSNLYNQTFSVMTNRLISYQNLSVVFVFFLFIFPKHSNAQDFLLQGWYWDFPKTCNGNNWADTLHQKSTELADAGFTHVWLPPFSRASFGNCSNGYDPKDLYDLGEFGQGPTHVGTRADIDALITSLTNNGIDPVADVVYNHRDGGLPETNLAVKDYITIHYGVGKNPYPSDRFRCVLPLGGSSGNGAGDYFFKISSKTMAANFDNKPYIFRAETSLVGTLPGTDMEAEPNGGGDCGEAFNTVTLGKTMTANVDGGGCRTDEFKLTLSASDFNPAGDELVIFLTNPNNDYADHRIYGIWNATAAADVVGQLEYQTYTDFTTMPSGQGAMNFENFKPNSGNTSTTFLNGDWDTKLFFYDYDQYIPDTQTKLFDWTKWLWNDVGIRGLRMDAIKHFDPAFVGDLMDELHDVGQLPSMVVGEFFDGNPVLLQNWIADVYANMDTDTQNDITVSIFDFALRNALKDACDNGSFDARNVFNSGIVNGVGGSPFNVVTFINNHDFRGPGEAVQTDAMLAYAYLLTNNSVGLPTVFYPDYYGTTIPDKPTQFLKNEIDQLMQIHKNYIFNSTNVSYLNAFGASYGSTFTSGSSDKTLLYQLSNGVAGREVLVAINYGYTPLTVTQNIDMTNLMQGDTLIDVVGNANQSLLVVDGSNAVDIQLPARSYAVWVQGNCVDDLVLNDVYIDPAHYRVQNVIESDGSVQTSTNVLFQAGNCIELLPDFIVELGAEFEAFISGCTN